MRRNVLSLAVLVFALVCGPLWGEEKRPEPRYEGKPIAYWVERLQKAESEQHRLEATQAIRAFGSDAAPAIPALVEMLDDRSPDFRKLVADLLYGLGPDANAAVPALVRSLKNQTARDPALVIKILRGVAGPDTREAVPELTKALQSEWADVRVNAALGLLRIEKNARAVVPVLGAALVAERYPNLYGSGTEFSILTTSAARALGNLGPDAREAVPQLKKAALYHEDSDVRVEAAEAIKKIDPQEFKKFEAERERLLQPRLIGPDR
jgi:HEAT repeat protein